MAERILFEQVRRAALHRHNFDPDHIDNGIENSVVLQFRPFVPNWVEQDVALVDMTIELDGSREEYHCLAP